MPVAMLPQTASDEQRTTVFSAYNVVGQGVGAVGAGAAAQPSLLAVEPLEGYRMLMWAYAGVGLLLALGFSRLSERVEVRQSKASSSGELGVKLARGRPPSSRDCTRWIRSAAASSSRVWSSTRSTSASALMSKAWARSPSTRMCSPPCRFLPLRGGGTCRPAAGGHPAARDQQCARNGGTAHAHLGTGDRGVAGTVSVPQMERPARQSYTMAILPEEERAAASGLMSVARNAAAAIGPGVSGTLLLAPAVGLPFLVAGATKLVYDAALFLIFRGVKPPEERRRKFS